MMALVLVRPAESADLAHIAVIYADAVRTSISTFDLEAPPLTYWTDRLASDETGDHILVVEDDGPRGSSPPVLGYAYSSSYRPRPAYARTREVSVYLAERARGRGLGRMLYDDLLGRLRSSGTHQVLAVIALPNDASVALHRSCGFNELGRLPEVGWKFDRWIDTALWGRTL